MITPAYPFRVEFEISGTCNLDCAYCYAKPFTNFNPPLKGLRYLFEKTREEANPFEAILLGGEPFTRKDAIEVIELAYKTFGNSVGISTNGTLLGKLDDKQLERLKNVLHDARTFIQISFDSLNPDTNETTRQSKTKKHSTEDIIVGMDSLEKHGVKFGIGIAITTSNINDIESTVAEMLKNYKSLVNINLEQLQPAAILGKERYNSLFVDKDHRIQVRDRVIGIRDGVSRQDVKITGIEEECSALNGESTIIDSYELKTCTAGLLRAGVLTNGDIVPCLVLRDTVVGNLYRESWKQIWDKSKERFFSLEPQSREQCYVNLIRTDSRESRIKIKV